MFFFPDWSKKQATSDAIRTNLIAADSAEEENLLKLDFLSFPSFSPSPKYCSSLFLMPSSAADEGANKKCALQNKQKKKKKRIVQSSPSTSLFCISAF